MPAVAPITLFYSKQIGCRQQFYAIQSSKHNLNYMYGFHIIKFKVTLKFIDQKSEAHIPVTHK